MDDQLLQQLERRRNDMLAVAKHAFSRAYAPYSQFRVGAAVLGANGVIYGGCNVENATYGATVCAERNAVAAAVAAGERQIIGCLVYTRADKPTPPCGICRQVLAEFRPDMLVMAVTIDGASTEWMLDTLLPFAFGPKDLLDT